MVIFDLPVEHPFSYIQIIGYCGMAMGIFAFSQKDDLRLKLLMMLMACLLIVHFILLGSIVAAVSSFLAGARAGLSISPFVIARRHMFAAGFVVLACVLGANTYSRPLDILPFITAVSGTFVFFYLSGIRMRIGFVVIGCVWLTHNILAQSYGPAIMEAFILAANVITIYRLGQEKAAS